MKKLLQYADNHTLVLIDEFGSGTEPAAGGAIAETILEELERREVFGVITTHYTNLKVYAENSQSVLNGAMLFDSANIRPLYKLEIGVPGNSFAFDLARKIGLSEQIVKRAEDRAGDDFIDLEKQLRKVSRNRRKLEATLTKIKYTDKNLENVTERYSKELSDIQRTKKEILEAARSEAKKILEEANSRIEQTIKSIKESQAEKEKTKQVRRNLKEFSDSIEKEKDTTQDEKISQKIAQLQERRKRQQERKNKRDENRKKADNDVVKAEKSKELEIGSKVKVKGKDLMGIVLSVTPQWVTIGIGEISSRVKKGDIEVISNTEFSGKVKAKHIVDENITKRKLNFKNEIDLRGYRLGEAIDAVENFIDDALLVGVTQLRILHGKGEGVLREEIRKILKINPSVLKFYDEDVRFGGAGITIVELR